MPGQISIRLPDTVIDRLNRTAKKMGVRRSELLRSSIEAGLDSFDTDGVKIDEQLRDLKRDILNSMNALPIRIRAVLKNGNETHSEKISAPTGTPKDDMSDEGIDVLDAHDPADKNARLISPSTDDTQTVKSDASSTRQAKTGRPKVIESTEREDTILARLKRALKSMTGGTEQMATELNMKMEILEEVLAGQRNVPLSRAIRVEAKLQQWESGVDQ